MVECSRSDAVEDEGPDDQSGASVAVLLLQEADEEWVEEVAKSDTGRQTGVGESAALVEVLSQDEEAGAGQARAESCKCDAS